MIRRAASAASTTVLVVLAAALFAIALAPQMGIRATILTSGSMAPAIPAGGMIAVEEVAPDDIEVGDVITYRGYTEDRLVTHRVLSLHNVQGELHFRTQGDANEFADGDLAPAAGLVGRMRWDLTPVGPLLSWLTGSRAKMLIPGLAGLWLALGEVREIRRSRRQAQGDGRLDRPTPAPMPSSPVLPPPWLAWPPIAPLSTAPHPPPLAPPASPAPAAPPAPPASPAPAPVPIAVPVATSPLPAPALAAAPCPPVPAVPAVLSWSASTTSDTTTTRSRSPWTWPGGGLRAATVGMATVLAVAMLQMSAASFLDSAAVSVAAISTTAVDTPTGTSATFGCGPSTVDPQVTVTWGEVGHAEGYEVRRRAGTSGDFAAVGTTTGATATSLTDTTVELDTTYEYVVAANAWSWESEPSSPPAQVTTAASC